MTRYSRLAHCLLLLVVAACGGGGGSSPPGPDIPGPGGSGGSGGSGGTAFDPTNPAGVTYLKDYHTFFNFSTPYPEGWSRTLGSFSPEPGMFIEIEEPQALPAYGFPASLRVTRVLQGERTLPDRVTLTETLESSSLSVHGLTATETVFDGDEVGISTALRFIETTIDLDGYRYAILATMEREDQYRRYSDLMRYIVQRAELGIDFIEVERLFDPSTAAVASNGEEYLVVACRPTTRQFFYGGSLVAHRLDRGSQRIGASILVDNQRIPCDEARPALSWDGTNYLVTYVREMDITATYDGRQVQTPQVSVVGKRIGPTGNVLDATPILISWEGLTQESTDLTNKPSYTPNVAFDGSRHVVVWDQTMNKRTMEVEFMRQIHGRFVSPDGSVSDPFVVNDELINLYGQSSYFYWQGDIAVGNDRIMVTFGPRGEPQDLSVPSPIYAQFFDFAGNALMAEPILIREDPGTMNPRYAQVAFSGTNFVVSWIEGEQREASINGGMYGIHARLVSPDGQLLNGGPDTVGTVLVPQEEIDREYLQLQFSDGEFLAVWAVIGGSDEGGIWGVRFSADLSMIGNRLPIGGTTADRVGKASASGSYPAFADTLDGGLAVWTVEQFVKAWRLPPALSGTAQ